MIIEKIQWWIFPKRNPEGVIFFELFSVVYNATPPGFLLENGGVWLIAIIISPLRGLYW